MPSSSVVQVPVLTPVLATKPYASIVAYFGRLRQQQATPSDAELHNAFRSTTALWLSYNRLAQKIQVPYLVFQQWAEDTNGTNLPQDTPTRRAIIEAIYSHLNDNLEPKVDRDLQTAANLVSA
jgi:hypothetical protein